MTPAAQRPDDGADEAARRSAWVALSDLFLDTTLDDRDIAAIAGRLRDTGLSVATLERIYQTEVAPACAGNLTALPGGVWTGFDPAWLESAIRRHLATPPLLQGWAPARRWRIARWTAGTRDDWLRVKRLLA